MLKSRRKILDLQLAEIARDISLLEEKESE